MMDAAKRLALEHKASDPLTRRIMLDPTSTEAGEIRLVEVTDDIPETGEVMPFRYAADPDDPRAFPICLVLLNPAEWRVIMKHDDRLLPGWSKPSSMKLLLSDEEHAVTA